MLASARHALALSFVIAALAPAHAEMLEFPAGDGMKAWPKLPAVFEWHQDQAASFQNTANVLLRDGDVYPDAPAVIMAKGLPRSGKSLAQVMDDDRAQLGDGAKKLADIADKDGKAFTVIAFTPGKSGTWQANAYAEEGRYFLVFSLTAKSQAEYDKVFPVFSQMTQNYAAIIPW